MLNKQEILAECERLIDEKMKGEKEWPQKGMTAWFIGTNHTMCDCNIGLSEIDAFREDGCLTELFPTCELAEHELVRRKLRAKRWVPGNEEEYYSTSYNYSGNIDIRQDTFLRCNASDALRAQAGLCFKTRAEAEQVLKDYPWLLKEM